MAADADLPEVPLNARLLFLLLPAPCTDFPLPGATSLFLDWNFGHRDLGLAALLLSSRFSLSQGHRVKLTPAKQHCSENRRIPLLQALLLNPVKWVRDVARRAREDQIKE